MSDKEHNVNGTGILAKKRFYIVISILIGIGVMVFWVKIQVSPNLDTQLDSAYQKINQTSQKINQTADAVDDVLSNSKVGIKNQKVLAKGLQELGSVVISNILNTTNNTKNVLNNTNEIADIKYNTEQILNRTMSNLNFSTPLTD